MAVRRKIMSQLNNLRQHLLNIMEDGGLDTRIGSQRLIDVVDVFRNEVEMAETGHKYPFFSTQRSVSGKMLKKLIDYDAGIIQQLEKALEAISTLERSGDDEEVISKGLRMLKEYITTARGQFENRVAVMKNVELKEAKK